MKSREAFFKVVEKCRQDAEYRKKFEASPAEALDEAGISVGDGVKVRLHQNTASLIHYVMPPPPAVGAMNEAELGRVAGGMPEDLRYGGYGSDSSYFAAAYRDWKREYLTKDGRRKK